MEKYIQLLRGVPYFRNLSSSDLLRIISSGQMRHFKKNKYIYYKDEPSEGMFVLFTGKVHLCNYSCEGQSQIFSIIEPVTMFNEVTAIDGGPNPATAIAVNNCLTWNIGYKAFEDLVRKYPDPVVGLAMMRVLAGRTRELITLCKDLSFSPVLSRCAKIILDLSNQGRSEINRREFPLTNLSSLVATAPESVSRSLSWLDKQGMIDSDRNYISVTDIEGLKDIAQRETV
jgi:CRP/FNR family transcriptional regulator